jgi:hypothetical protein
LTTPQIVQILATPLPQVCWNAGNGVATFYNPPTNTNNIYLGYSSSIQPSITASNVIYLIPGQSVTLTAGAGTSIYMVASNNTSFYIIPGDAGFAYSNLTINGPVTAEITGPVTVEGTIDIGNTPTVDLAAGATVDIAGTADVSIQNANIDVIGAGGYILPGQTANLYNNSSGLDIVAGGGSQVLLNNVNISEYNSLDFSLTSGSTTGTLSGTTSVTAIEISFTDAVGVQVRSYTINAPIAHGTTLGGQALFSVPCAGSFVSVVLYNFGTSGTGAIVYPAYTVTVSGSYRNITKVNYQSFNYDSGTIDGLDWIASANTSQSSYLPWVAQINNPTLATGTNYAYALNGYSGNVEGFFRPNGGTPTVTIYDMGAAVTLGGISPVIDSPATIFACEGGTAGDIVPVTFNLPPSPCAALIAGTTGESFNLQLMGTE